jgi:hypothetical protein
MDLPRGEDIPGYRFAYWSLDDQRVEGNVAIRTVEPLVLVAVYSAADSTEYSAYDISSMPSERMPSDNTDAETDTDAKTDTDAGFTDISDQSDARDDTTPPAPQDIHIRFTDTTDPRGGDNGDTNQRQGASCIISVAVIVLIAAILVYAVLAVRRARYHR